MGDSRGVQCTGGGRGAGLQCGSGGAGAAGALLALTELGSLLCPATPSAVLCVARLVPLLTQRPRLFKASNSNPPPSAQLDGLLHQCLLHATLLPTCSPTGRRPVACRQERLAARSAPAALPHRRGAAGRARCGAGSRSQACSREEACWCPEAGPGVGARGTGVSKGEGWGGRLQSALQPACWAKSTFHTAVQGAECSQLRLFLSACSSAHARQVQNADAPRWSSQAIASARSFAHKF